MERVTSKMVEDKKEYDLRLQEYAQLLDIRAERIKVISLGRICFSNYCLTTKNVYNEFILQKLESQMRDVAYGTKQYNVVTAPEVREIHTSVYFYTF